MPPLHLAKRGAELWLVTDSGRHLVPPKNGNLRRLGIFAFGVRGSSNYLPALKAGSFSAGRPVTLLREPDNPYDSNAVAICSHGSKRPAGYVNKQKAAALAKRLDAGETLEAIALRGSPRGSVDGPPFSVLVTTPEILAHLKRRL
ncbi:HIRAN domain-containing protein [Nesterenkonia sp. CF4.4]|uniref:HIRAN domain-containing protein n=1 Tax=Nesterenkonia sp. CF4.4 TaxID=3373079 RepID=UPI003EE490AA